MSKIAHVQYPVPVRFVPRGGRNERYAFRREAMPVTIREEDPGAFMKVFSYHVREWGIPSYYAFEGKLWAKLWGWGVDSPDRFGAFGPDGFVRFLEWKGPPAGLSGTDVGLGLARTPLLAGYDVANGVKGPFLFDRVKPNGSVGKEFSRGDDIDLSAVRRVVHDGAAQAADDVARFMEGVVFAGDAVFLRVPAPQVLRRSLGSFAVEPYPNHAVDLTGLMRLDEVRENRELKEYLEESPDKAAVVDAVVRGIPARFLGDDDLVLTVNRMPRFVLKEACGVLEWGFTGPPALRDAIQAHAEMLRPWMVRGMTGSIALHEGETVLRLCREFVNLATRELDSDKRFATLLRVLAETERKALPRLREMRPAEIGPDDLDALADVSPRAPGM